jgi:hypothetical protein
MNSKDLVVDYGGNRKVIKNIGKVLPNNGVSVFGLTFHVESIVLRNGSRLMVSPDHVHLGRILYLEEAK